MLQAAAVSSTVKKPTFWELSRASAPTVEAAPAGSTLMTASLAAMLMVQLSEKRSTFYAPVIVFVFALLKAVPYSGWIIGGCEDLSLDGTVLSASCWSNDIAGPVDASIDTSMSDFWLLNSILLDCANNFQMTILAMSTVN